MRVRADLNISLDGFGTTTDGTPENPMGEDWMRLVDAYIATRTFRSRVLGDTSGAGTTDVDDRYASAYFEGVGAEIMGAGMFGLHTYPDDPDWEGWWGENPPFHVPVFVLTHHARAPLVMEGGTTFHFVTEGIEVALARARDAAQGKDVRVGGGVSVIQQYLRQHLIDEMHIAISPVLLGAGERLFEGVNLPTLGYSCTEHVATPRATHVVFTRV